jgi:hypothetical protein
MAKKVWIVLLSIILALALLEYFAIVWLIAKDAACKLVVALPALTFGIWQVYRVLRQKMMPKPKEPGAIANLGRPVFFGLFAKKMSSET